MDRGAEFIEHLPQLRSYARALTGSQKSGDQLVIAVLRRLGQKRHSSNKKPIILLFEVLSILWNGIVGEQIRNIRPPPPDKAETPAIFRPRGGGRPTKRDRRRIEAWKDGLKTPDDEEI